MKLLEFPIRRHQFSLVAFLCVAALGLYSFLSLPREEDPHINLAAGIVTAIYPGADPVDLERSFARPMEDRIAELGDIRRLESIIADGVGSVIVEFEADVDADEKVDAVRRELNALRTELPPEIRRVELRRVSPSLVNIVQLALVSETAPYGELEAQARELRDLLKRVPGVRNADSWAFPRRELRVTLDLPRLAANGLNAMQVQRLLQARNANIPAGVIDVDSRSFSLQTSGGLRSLEELRDTVIGARNGLALRLGDVATVEWHDQPYSYIGRFKGQRAVFVTANQKDGTSILKGF